jgi:tRNA (guanine37-N1)-methyltransferase
VCTPYLQESILKRAQAAGVIRVGVHNIRDYAPGKHAVTDDEPYGGGGGMVMKPEPVFNAVEAVLGVGDGGRGTEDGHAPSSVPRRPSIPVILLTPQGRTFTQAVARELSQYSRIALICGRYEGFDERIREHLATDQISIGDFVITGGELAALVIVDAVTRLLPGTLGDPTGAEDDSFEMGLLEYPHYTRPAEYRGWRVPDVLVSGDHGKVAQWRREQALRRTWLRRPDLLAHADLNDSERALIEQWRQGP